MDIAAMASWAQVGVSLLSFYLLYLVFKLQADTFIEQRKVTNEQIELSRIEHIKYRKQFQPLFFRTNTSRNIWADSENMSILVVGVQHNDAFDISVTCNEKNIESIFSKNIPEYLKRDEFITIIPYQPVTQSVLHTRFNIYINFNDENGEPYMQIIEGTLDFATMSPPLYLGESIL